MGKPSAPDPYQTANAQTQSNLQTATANANINRVDQNSPFGSSKYTIIGTNPDGTPKYQQDTTFSAPMQGLFDSQVANQQNQQNISTTLLNNVASQYGKPVDTSGVNPLNSGLSADQMAALNSRYATSAGPAQTASTQGAQAGQADAAMGRAGQAQAAQAQAGQANAFSAQAGQANAFSAQAGQARAAQAQAGQAQDTQASLGQYVTSAGDGGGPIQRSISIDSVPGFIKGAQDAAYANQMGYLTPQFQNDQHDLEAKLAAQGITQGSDAWNRAQSELSRNQTFQQQQAQNASFGQGLQGGQTVFGMLQGQGQFANAAQAQGYEQALQNADLANHAADAATQSSQFNAGQANQLGMFNAGQANQVGQFNAGQANQVGQFNAGQQTAVSQANADRLTSNNQFNAGQNTQVNLANAEQLGQASQFNAGQQTAVSQANADRATQVGTFNAGQQTQASQANADRLTNTSQFNAGQQTQNSQFNAGAANQNSQFNAGAANQMGMFNAGLNNQAVNGMFGNMMGNASLGNAAHGQGMTDAFAKYNQPLNTYNQLQTGAQASMPQFASVPGSGMAPTDVAGLVNGNYANRVGAANGQNQALAQAASLAAMVMMA